MSFTPVAVIDVWGLQASLFGKRQQFSKATARHMPGSPHHDSESIVLRGPKADWEDPIQWLADLPHVDAAILKDWKAASNVLSRIRKALIKDDHVPVLGKAMLVSLKPSGWVDWHIDEGEYAEKHDRFHLPIVTNPGAMLYSGSNQMSPACGILTWINNRQPHCAVNLGKTPRVHLILDVRKPE